MENFPVGSRVRYSQSFVDRARVSLIGGQVYRGGTVVSHLPLDQVSVRWDNGAEEQWVHIDNLQLESEVPQMD